MSAKSEYIVGLSHLTQEDLPEAEEFFRRSVLSDPVFGLGYLGLCQVLDRLGRVDEAIQAAVKAIELMPADPLPHASLSRLYQQKDMIDEAEAEMAISMRMQNEAGGG